MNPIVKINKIYPDAHIPTYGSKCAACADVYAYIPRRYLLREPEKNVPSLYEKAAVIREGLYESL